MRADEVRSIAASVVASVGAGDRVVVTAGDARDTWTAWFVGDEAIAPALRTKLREVAPDVATAVTWIGLPSLPGDGEIDRLPGLARRIGPARPDTALERIVAVAWQEALGAAVDSVDDDFFAIGGHSLLAADVAARLDDIVGVDVPLTIVFDHPTIREQAAWLAGVAASGVVAAPRGPAKFVAVIARALDRRAIEEVGARYGVTSEVAEIDLGALRGAARRTVWQELLGQLVAGLGPDAPWRVAQVRFSSRRTLAAIAFDGRRVDATSARRWLREVDAAVELRIWPRRQLAPAITLESAPELIAGWRAVRIAAPRARALLDLGRQQGATPLATLAAAIAVVVGRRTRRDQVVLAIGASLRAGELRDALGALTTTTTIAIDVADEPSFLDVVDRTSTAICRAWAAAAGAIVGAPPRAADASVDLDVTREPQEAWRRTSGSAPLAFALATSRSGVLAGRVGYDDADITAEDADVIAGELAALVDEVTADPARKLGRGGPGRATPAIADDAPPFGDPLVLSHAQERLWFVEGLSPGTTANHLQRVYRIEGKLDADALGRAIAAMMARHDALRTVFRTIDAQPRQLVARDMPIDHAVEAATDDAAVAALAAVEYTRTFSLGTGPLWRTRLVRVGDGDHRLILTVHHLIIDALSFLVWHREVAEHYQAEASRTTPRLAPLGTTVAAIANWERSPVGQQRIARDLAYWLDNLAGAAPLDLPLDYRRPPVHGLGRHDVTRFLSPDRTAEIRALGRRQGTTLSVTLLAAAAAFLARHTRQDDLVCVVPASRRDDPGRKSMIGLLLNLLPLRLRLTGDPTFAEIVARTNRALRDAMAHAEAPFERIVAGLGLPREPGRQPLFDVILNMIPGAERLWWGETRVTLEGITGSAQPCDLVIGAHSRPGGFLGLTVRGRDDVFAAQTIGRMASRFETLLVAAMLAPNTRLSALPIVPTDEHALMIETWNATIMPLPDTTVHGLFEARAREQPDAVALLQGDRTMTYRELDLAASRVARTLPPGKRVGVHTPPSPELAVAALGILKAGSVYVPFGANPARIDQLAEHVELELTAEMLAGDGLERDAATDPDAAAYVVFTSGSTGRAKGVSTTHRALVNQIAWFERDLPWQPGEVACLRSSAAFVDSMWELFGPLAAGVPLVIATPDEMADPRLLIAALERHRVTRLVVVPSLLQAMLALGKARWPTVSLVLATSEELKPALVDQFYAARPSSRLVNLYGASETADQVAAWEVRPGDRGLRTPIGKPIANTRIYVLDANARPVPIGVAGEIYASGVGVGDAYLPGAPADDQARFAADPFWPGSWRWKTRDRGRWRHDGVLEYHGRLDSQLKIRGVRVDPSEVESAIMAHPSVASVAVVGSTVELDGEMRLAAFVVPEPGATIDARELRRFLRGGLPETLIPTSVTTLDALPLGPTGKLDRRALPMPRTTAIESRPPQGAVEHAVALAWELLLGKAVGAEDDFFAAGGQSLLAAQLGARLAERFAVELPLAVLFERPTVAMQAQWLEAAVLATPHAGIPFAGGGPAPLGFAQERLAFAHAMSPRAPAPKIRSAFRIEGPLDRDRLLDAMRAVAARQSALRTVFDSDGAGQRVMPALPLDHIDDDVRTQPEGDRTAAMRSHVDDERTRPFDLAVGPPWRTRLVRIADDVHVLIVTFHHYVADGISVQLWIDELDACYAGTTDTLPALAISPADVAVWQRRMVDGAYWDAARRFWRDTLAGASSLDLPLAAPRTAWSSGASGLVRENFTPDDADALAELARGERTTLFGLLLAGASVLLHRITRRTDLVVGTIAAGRDRPEVRSLIGLFLNPLPLRLDLSGDPDVRELVRRVDHTARSALAHGDLPFERIVADANPERRPFRQPLFDVVLNHHPPGRPPRLGDLKISYIRGIGTPVAPYELMIRTITRDRGLTIQIDYQRERFADDTAASWLADYAAILRGFVADPTRRLTGQ